jgi:hypothetical protein
VRFSGQHQRETTGRVGSPAWTASKTSCQSALQTAGRRVIEAIGPARPISAASPANPGFSPSSHQASATDRLCRIAASSAARSAVAPHYLFVYPCEHQRRANAKDAGSPSRYFSRIFGRGLPLRKSPLRNFWLPRPRAPSRRRSRLSRFGHPGMASNNPPLRVG